MTLEIRTTDGRTVAVDPMTVIWLFKDKETGCMRLVTRERQVYSAAPDQTVEQALRRANPTIWVGAYQGSRIPFADLPNTRGLGGMETADGVIARFRLIRSGSLHGASQSDIHYLTKTMGLKVVVDLRTEMERALKPDPVMEGVRNEHVPLLNTREYEETGLRTMSEAGIRQMMKEGPAMMEVMYRKMVTEPEGIRGLKRFFEILLAQPEGAVLWHCTQGKDRTGVCAALLEEILGCDRRTIMADYLFTNACLKEEEEDTEARMRALMHLPVSAVSEMNFLFEASPRYLEGAWAAIDETYGSMNAYLEKALGLTAEKQDRLRHMYTA